MNKIASANRQLLPAKAYHCPHIFTAEQQLLFAKTWNFVCMSDELKQAGDYQCVQVGPYPIVVTRDQRGELRGFHNICRHRGAQILEGSGSSPKGFSCPYHRWFYRLDGRLKSIPQQATLFAEADKTKLGLKPVAIGTFRGLVFVNPDPHETESFSTFVADLDNEIGPHQPDRMLEITASTYEFEANWKLVVENFLDQYHLFHLHKIDILQFDHDALDIQTTGRHGLMLEPVNPNYREWLRDVYRLDAQACVPGFDNNRYGGLFTLLFPNLGWVGLGHLWRSYQVIPVAVDRSLVVVRDRAMEEGAEQIKGSIDYQARRRMSEQGNITMADAASHPLQSTDLMQQDMWICRQLQQSVASPVFEVGPLASKYESLIAFHQQNLLDFLQYE
jgi:choline monooxygenase